MYIYIMIITLLTLFALFYRSRTFKAVHLKTLLLPLFSILFILCLVFLSDTAVKAAYNGIKLWLDIVFPSLFPFFVASELLSSTGFVRAMGILLEPVMRPLFNVPGCGSFTFLMGITSGYPIGAKITAQMREEKLLTREEAERLLAFSNNSGPLFIIGAVSIGMFKMQPVGFFLLVCHILACITVGIMLMLFSKKVASTDHSRQLLTRFKKQLFSAHQAKSFGNTFGEAIRNSVMTMLMVGGFIIFFSVIINLLLDTGLIHLISAALSFLLTPLGVDREIIASVLSGVFEITTGANMASKSASTPLAQQLTAASLIIGWGGLSVHSQVLSIIHKTDIHIKTYLLGKLMQGVLASVYTFIGVKTAGSVIFTEKPAFFPFGTAQSTTWYHHILGSLESLFVFLVLFIGLAAFSAVIRLIRQLIGLHKLPGL